MSLVPVGPNDGGTFVDDTTVGTVAWVNASNASTQDDTNATANLNAASQVSHYLKATNFSFNVPSGATISGIVMIIDRSTVGLGSVKDNSVKIVQGGTIGGTEQALAGDWGADTNDYTIYGSPTDLWGLTWAASDINASTFGVVVSAKLSTGISPSAGVDHIQLVIYYEPAAGDPDGTDVQMQVASPSEMDASIQATI